MSSGPSSCGLPEGTGRSGGLHLVCRGGTAHQGDRALEELARGLEGQFSVLVQRGRRFPVVRESLSGGGSRQTLLAEPDGLRWQCEGSRDHFLPLAAWDEAELVLSCEDGPGQPRWYAAGLGEEDLSIPAAAGSGTAEAVIQWIQQRAPRPELCGLVLAGGQSRRMGRDKSLLEYNGRPQWERAFSLLEETCAAVYLSRRPGQDTPSGVPCLEDRFLDLGPMGGLLTALHAHPERAWLVLACDLPTVDGELLARLVRGRRHTALATAFRDPASGLPEPLCAIWEPRSRARLHRFLGEGVLCPRKVLIRSLVALLDLPRGRALENVNRPEDYRRITEGTEG